MALAGVELGTLVSETDALTTRPHLSVLEAEYIKISKPILSRQKEFVYSLQIFH